MPLKVAGLPFDRMGMISYYCCIVNLSLRHIRSPWKMKPWLGSLEVTESGTIQQTAYDFLLSFSSNYGRIWCRFW